MKLDPNCVVHLADDGVARSYTPNGTVIDAVALTNVQLKAFKVSLDAVLSSQIKDREHFNEVWENVDGRDVTDQDQIYNPLDSLKPVLFQTNGTSPKPHQLPSASEAADVDTALERRFNPGWDHPCLYAPCWSADQCFWLGGCTACLIPDLVLTGTMMCF